MSIAIVPFEARHEEAAARFNERMRAGNAPTGFLLPTRATVNSASDAEAPVRLTQFVAADEEGGEVHGGILLLEHPGWINGRVETVVNIQSPLSEGIVDAQYSMLALQLIMFTLQRSPYAFAVGMGSETAPLPKVLKAMGWKVRLSPFFFRLLRVSRCLRQLAPLRKSPLKRLAADGAAFSGAGWAAMQWLQRKHGASLSGYTVEPMNDWLPGCNDVWNAARERMSFAIVRDTTTLPLLNGPRIQRYVLRQANSTVGWFSLLVSNMRDNQYFGNLRIGVLADNLALAGHDAALIAAAARQAAALRCDLICSNQLPEALQAASREAGWLSGPSNYVVATSRALTKEMNEATAYVSRRDGDGLINLTAPE